MDSNVDLFLDKATTWQKEMIVLRSICLDCGLTETYKWMHPCYTFQNSNVVLIHGFKDYCALLIHKGALLNDPHHILIQQTKNVQAARQIRFTNVSEIEHLKITIKEYIFEAIEIEKAGLKVPLKTTSEFDFPKELQIKFDEDPHLKSAFDSLTPGRQRGYLLYFSQAKQSKTRESRIETCIPRILIGKGLQDR